MCQLGVVAHSGGKHKVVLVCWDLLGCCVSLQGSLSTMLCHMKVLIPQLQQSCVQTIQPACSSPPAAATMVSSHSTGGPPLYVICCRTTLSSTPDSFTGLSARKVAVTRRRLLACRWPTAGENFTWGWSGSLNLQWGRQAGHKARCSGYTTVDYCSCRTSGAGCVFDVCGGGFGDQVWS